MNTNMEQLTTVLFKNSKQALDAKTATLFFNDDGSETTGNVYFPHDPVVLKTNTWFAKNVRAVFTTIEKFVEYPPKFIISILNDLWEVEQNSNVDMVVNALTWYAEQERNTQPSLYFTVFDDGTLVYNYIKEVEHE